MRKRAVVVGSALMITAGTLGVAAAQASTGPHVSGQKFTVVERALTDTTADIAPPGDSRGDVLAFRNPIFTADNATRIGTDNGSCVRTEVGVAYQCQWTVGLDGGSLTVAGPFYDANDSRLAVIGGTGRWADTSGQMTLHARDAAGSAYDFRFDLR